MTLMHNFDRMIKQAERCYNHICRMEEEQPSWFLVTEHAKLQMQARIQALKDAKDMVYKYDLRFHPRY